MALLYLTPVFNGVCSFFFGGVCQYDLNEVSLPGHKLGVDRLTAFLQNGLEDRYGEDLFSGNFFPSIPYNKAPIHPIRSLYYPLFRAMF
ncbi:hypothetical protein IEQ34_024907 [Dendrobium chrysotoxum]|uniref:Uncharacterized protein n=1 Tax=Dendrobium chrysotoxum TaxID=161865 RepID=A0AAV7FRA4_DENCH|nr:hypothetical protein IEQ34_024907 [Dendrobium chrysotoxum]